LNTAVVTALTVTSIGIIRQIVQVITFDKSSTTITGFIAGISTVLTENEVFITVSVILPDTISTVRTDTCVLIQALRTESFIIEEGAIIHRMFFVTTGADEGFSHIDILLILFTGCIQQYFKKIIYN